MSVRIWHIEDSAEHRADCRHVLEKDNYEIAQAFSDYQSARQRLDTTSPLAEDFPHVILLDIDLGGDKGGLELLELIRIKKKWDADLLPVLIVTGSESGESLKKSFDLGANDFINKAILWQYAPRLQRVLRAAELECIRKEACETKQPMIDGESEIWKELLAKLKRRAADYDKISLFGESGTGKEQLARYLHRESPRSHKQLVSLNCGAISKSIIHSELFGHKKGSFTGGDQDRQGWLRTANEGTLFLDEFADLPSDTLGMLNHVFDNGEVQILGTEKKAKVDLLFITATSKDIATMVDAKTFSPDVMYRVNASREVRITVPALRERGQDIVHLAERFLKRRAQLKNCELELDDSARAALLAYHWPGNVRQLDSVIKNAVSNANGESTVRDVHLGLDIAGKVTSVVVPANYDEYERLEIEMIRAALAATPNGRNISLAADALATNYDTLYSRVIKFGLLESKPKKESGPAKKTAKAQPSAKSPPKVKPAVETNAAPKKSAKMPALENSKPSFEKSKKTTRSATPKPKAPSRAKKIKA